MIYELRHDFMKGAIIEYNASIIRPLVPLPESLMLAHMRSEFKLKERNDWFQMYCMGGAPWPGQGGKV